MARRRRRSQSRGDDFEDEEPVWEGPEVDLHGCSVAAAKRRVSEALTRCRAAGRSPLLVITGRGSGSFAGNGVLGPEVGRWLRGDDARALGVAEVRAMPGGGAFEVTVRRRNRS